MTKSNKCTLDQAKDTGMALVLVGLIVWLNTKNKIAIVVSIGILLVTMATPRLLLPAARIWFGFSEILGKIVSRIVLSFIFIFLVIPIGLARRWAKKDSLQLRVFKKTIGTVFIDRNHRYLPSDLAKPF
jgi:hypothetical protein